ncbi:PAS domain S-box protein [Litoribacter populi]|uniref:PAS domain S-box protein n=1 Tax=Litoribacter populi TaxID=2598460 RepID=UPI00117F93FE|nr:PAS domain S-box protein [Litoribacter populi]
MLKKSDIWAIYENTLTPSIIIDGEKVNMRVTRCNPSFCQLAGKPLPFFEGLKIKEAFRLFISTNNMELLDNLMNSLILVKTKKKPHDMKVQRVYIPTQKTGSLRERKWRIINTPIIGQDKKLKSILLSITDVTEQIHLQEKDKAIYFNLSYQQQIYKGIFDNHPNMLFKLDNEGFITSTNGNFQFSIEHKEEELTKMLFTDIIQPEDELMVKGMLQKCLHREIVTFKVSLKTRRGRSINCEATLMPLAVQEKVVGIYGVLVDKTQEKLQQQQSLQKTIYTETIDNVTKVLLEGNHGQETIQNAFRLTGNAILVDLISFYKINQEDKQLSSRVLYKWKKSETVSETFQSFAPEDFQYCLGSLQKNRIFKTKVSELKKSTLRTKLELRGTKSIIFFPVFCNKSFWGVITFEDLHDERSWQLEDVTFLKTIVINLSISIERLVNIKALTDSRQQLDSIIKNIPGIAYRCLHDADWTMLYINEDVEKHTGYKAEEFTSGDRTFASIIHPDDLPTTYEASQQADLVFCQLEYRVICADGSIKWFEDRNTKIYDDQGQLKYYDGVMWDITQMKEVSQQVAFAHRKFESLIQKGGELYAITTDNAYFTFTSSTYKSILGYENKELIGKCALNFIHPDDLPEIILEFAKIEHLKQIKLPPYRFRNATGNYRYIESHATDLRQDPAVKGILVTSRDITERIEEMERLQLMDQIIRNTQDAVIIVETLGRSIFEGEIIYANESSHSISGIENGDLVGKRIAELIYTIKDQEDYKRKAAEFDPEAHTRVELEKVNQKGESYWVNMETFPMRNLQNKISHYIIIQREITVEKNLAIRKNLLNSLKNTFSLSMEIKDGLIEVLDTLNNHIKAALSEAWVISKDNSKITRVATVGGNEAGRKFVEASEQVNEFDFGVGIPGITWQTAQPQNKSSLQKTESFVRKEPAKQHGMDQIYSFPMVSQNKVYGVLTFLSSNPYESNVHHFMDTLTELGQKLGMELEKKRMMEELNSFFDLSSDLMCILHKDRLYKVNESFAGILGYQVQDIQGRSLFDFIYPEDIDRTKSVLHLKIEGENFPNFENRYLTKSGDIKWISWSTACDPEEPVLYAVGKDITEKKAWQDNLLTINKRLNQAQAIGKVGYWYYDFTHNKLEWTDEVYTIYGKSKEYYQPDFQKSIDCVHPEDRYMLLIHDEHALEKDYYAYHHRLVMEDGTTKYVDQKINIIKNELGEITAWEGVIQDVTEIKRWQMALNLSNEKYKLAMQATNEMLWDWQIDDNVVTRGNSYLSLLGNRFRKSRLQDWLDVIHPDDRDNVQDSIESALRDRFQVQWKAEYRIHKKDGETAYIVDRGSIMRNQDGVAERIIGAALDVSESRRMIHRIKKQNHALREIAWTQSHVVRAPLARLKGLINMLESESPEEAFEVFKEMLPHIKNSTDELDQVISQVVRRTEELD